LVEAATQLLQACKLCLQLLCVCCTAAGMLLMSAAATARLVMAQFKCAVLQALKTAAFRLHQRKPPMQSSHVASHI
jgi:hypothetical protein